MTQIIFQLATGQRKAVDAVDGESLMEAARREDLPGIDAECGGSCACATCHVYVDERFAGTIEPAEEFESEMLDFVKSDRRAHSRLACQIRVQPSLAGLTVIIPG